MKRKLRIRISKMTIASSLIVISGLWGFAGVAISAEDQQNTSTPADTSTPVANQDEIANGSPIEISAGVSITPIPGWRLERRAAGMSLIMKEVLPASLDKVTDYSKPLFTRNISVMTLSKARPIDEKSIPELKEEIAKMFTRDSSLSDFSFTETKLFDYKEKNDGVVLFSQLTANNYQMMQMQIVVSSEQKTYLLTYSDLAANFSNPATFDAAWKSMTSINVPGLAPKRYHQEVLLGGIVSGALIALVLPFFLIRWRNARRIRKLAEELQYDWDHGALKTDADYELSAIGNLDATRPMVRRKNMKTAAASSYESLSDSSVSLKSHKNSLESSVDSFSTRHSRFA